MWTTPCDICFNDGCRSTIDEAVTRCHKSCDNVGVDLFTACEALATPVFAGTVLGSEAACTKVCQQMALRAANATFADIPAIVEAGPEAVAAAVVAVEALGVALDYSCANSCSAVLKLGLPVGEAAMPLFCECLTGIPDPAPTPAPKPIPHPADIGCDGKKCGDVCTVGSAVGTCHDGPSVPGSCGACDVPAQGCDNKKCGDACVVNNLLGECHDGPGPSGSCGACIVPDLSAYRNVKKVIGGCDANYGDGSSCWAHAKYLLGQHKSQEPADALNKVLLEQRDRNLLSSQTPPTCSACHPIEIAARIKGVPLTAEEQRIINGSV